MMIHSVVTPEKPTKESYAGLTKKVRGHFLLKPSPIVQHFKFKTCVSQPDEKIRGCICCETLKTDTIL